MAIISVTEDLHSGGGDGGGGEVTSYTRHWIVVTSETMVDGYGDVIVADDGVTAIPDRFSTFTNTGWSDLDNILIHKTAQRRKEAPWIWDVVGEYEELPGNEEDPEGPENVTIESGHDGVRMWTVSEDFEVDVDLDGKLYANSSGTTYKPKRRRREHLIAVEITRRIREFIAANWDFLDTINDAPLWGWDTYHILCLGITPGVRMWDEEGSYYEAKVEFRIRKTPWHPLEILDRGLFKIIDKDTGQRPTPGTADDLLVPIHIADGLGIPIMEPELLDGDAWPLAKGADPFFNEFKEYESADFDLMNLPELNVELGTTTTTTPP